MISCVAPPSFLHQSYCGPPESFSEMRQKGGDRRTHGIVKAEVREPPAHEIEHIVQ